MAKCWRGGVLLNPPPPHRFQGFPGEVYYIQLKNDESSGGANGTLDYIVELASQNQGRAFPLFTYTVVFLFLFISLSLSFSAPCPANEKLSSTETAVSFKERNEII